MRPGLGKALMSRSCCTTAAYQAQQQGKSRDCNTSPAQDHLDLEYCAWQSEDFLTHRRATARRSC